MKRIQCERVSRSVLIINDEFFKPELEIRHSVGIIGRNEEGKMLDNRFLVQNKNYKGNSNKPFSFYYMKTYDYISFVSKKYKHKFNGDEFESWNKFNLPPTCFFYMKRTLDSIEKFIKETDDIFFLKEDEKTPSCVNDKYLSSFWGISTFGRYSDCLKITLEVIHERTDSYPGLKLTNLQGIIAIISFDQFFNLKIILENLINSFYSSSIELQNLAFSQMILDNQNEKGDK